MRLLFEIDKKDYKQDGTVCTRPSFRGIIINDDRLALIHSLKYNYYKFPGGGAEPGESHISTLIREVKEESGLEVDEGSVREYGYVHRVQKGQSEDIFIQDNYYYLCSIKEGVGSQNLDDYEKDEQFALEYVTARHAIEVNRNESHGEKDNNRHFKGMIERENEVLRLLIEDFFKG